MDGNVIPPKGPVRRHYHGHKTADGGSREYHCYSGMKARCGNPNIPHYHRYGGRGIQVCDRWKQGFIFFLEDMGRCPSPNHSIERRDNDGNYEPLNCYWADTTAQANNRRSNKILDHDGRQMTQAQWSRETGVKPSTLCARLKSGWPVEQALSRGVF